MAEKSGAPDPMHQFEIVELVEFKLFDLNLSFTNSSLFMVFSVALIILLTLFTFNGRGTVPTRLQSIAELSYEFVGKMVRDNVGDEGQKYFSTSLLYSKTGRKTLKHNFKKRLDSRLCYEIRKSQHKKQNCKSS